MRVALYHNLPPGGALRAAWEFARRCGPDVKVDLFTLDFGHWYPFDVGVRRDFASHVAQVHRVPVDAGRWGRFMGGRAHRIGLLAGIRRSERAIADQINHGGYDVAFVHPCWFSQTPSLLCDLTLPTVYYMHEVRRASFESEYRSGRSTQSLRTTPGRALESIVQAVLARRDRQAASSPERILTNSAFTRDACHRHYGREAEVCYLGIDDETFDLPQVQTPGVQAGRYVLSVGGFEEFKGHHLIVEAIGLISSDSRPDLHIVFERCAPEYRRAVLARSAELGVTVHEHRGVSDAVVRDLMAGAQATVLAAQLEPFGLVALESMACGTPVVACNEGGYLETVTPGLNGWLVGRSPSSLAAGIRCALSPEFQRTPQFIRDSVAHSWTWDAAIKRQVGHLSSVAAADV